MRRLGMISILSLSLVALLSAGVLARGPAASFSVKASHAEQGGHLVVRVEAVHSVKGTFLAVGVVHFASGDVPVVLARKGGSGQASVKVPVGVAEQPGRVAIDVSITYKGITRSYATNGWVTAAGGGSEYAPHD